jgi:hypothetical protein
MEQFNDKIFDNDDSFELAVETTYKIVTGKLDIDEFQTNGRLYMLYDPVDVTEKELKTVLQDIIEYYIDTEEYEKCQEIKNILEKGVKFLLPKITFDEHKPESNSLLNSASTYEQWNKNKKTDEQNPLDKMIDVLRKLNAQQSKKAFDKIEKDFSFTNLELWSIMGNLDKEIFKNNFSEFEQWANKLSIKLRNYYTDRLISEKPLIPTKEETPDYSGYDYNDINNIKIGKNEEMDYNNIVISFIDNFTCISNFDLSRIHRIKFQLLKFGILDSEIREKTVEGKTLYTLVYENSRTPNKLDWK